jgi:hypothetical protein
VSDSTDSLTTEQLLEVLMNVRPHDEGGQPMVSMHFALFKRILGEITSENHPATFEEALEAEISRTHRLTNGQHAVGANNFRDGAKWAKARLEGELPA